MTHKTILSLFDEKLSNLVGLVRYGEVDVDELLEKKNKAKIFLSHFLTAEYERGKRETEKAFGGCLSCYGKGYNTVKIGQHSCKDFGDEVTFSHEVEPCVPCPKCERGKQFAGILARLSSEYARGLKDGETTKNGKERYTLGYADGKRETEERVMREIELSKNIVWVPMADPMFTSGYRRAIDSLSHSLFPEQGGEIKKN